MDLYQPPPRITFNGDKKPYLSLIEREAFANMSEKELYEIFKKRFEDLNHSEKVPDSFVVHVPFTQEEHDYVIEYLSIMKFMNPQIFQHNFPIQLEEKLTNRNRYHILNYISDLIYRKDSSFEEGEALYARKPKEDKPDICKKTIFKEWKKLYRAICCDHEVTSISGIRHITKAAFIVFANESQPLVINMGKIKDDDESDGIELSTLVTSALKFIDSYSSCVTYGTWATIYYQNCFYVFNFTKPGRIRNSRTYHSVKIPSGEADLSNKSYELIPSKTQLNTFVIKLDECYYFCSFQNDSAALSYTKVNEKLRDAKYTEDGRIILLTSMHEIKEFDENDSVQEINGELKDFSDSDLVECEGDAYVFANGNEVIVVPFDSPNEPAGQIEYRFEFELDAESIVTSAYSNGSLAFRTSDSLYVCRCNKTKRYITVSNEDLDVSQAKLYPITYKTMVGDETKDYTAFAVISNGINIFNTDGSFLFNTYEIPQDKNSGSFYTYINPNGKFFIFTSDTGITYIELNNPIL